MGHVRIVWGSATGPTALASYDAALAAANVHDYNLVTVSSVLPAGTTIEIAGRAPDLGPVGERLVVVESRRTTPFGADPNRSDGDSPGIAVGLGWAQAANGRGIVYEGTGSRIEQVNRSIETGLETGLELRGFEPVRSDRAVLASDGRTERTQTASSDHEATRTLPGSVPESNEGYLTAVLLAVYGESDPIL